MNALSVLAGGVVNVASPALHPHFGPIAYAIAGAAFGAVATFAQAAAGFGNGTVAGNREFFAAYAVAGAADGFVLRLVPRRRERRAGHSYGNQGP